jgi:signal transduction histidine kinase
MVALVAAVPAASLLTMKRANRVALRELREGEGRLAQNTASSLHGYLESFDRDTRLLANMATGMRNHPIDARAQDDAILQGFQALVTVVPHYRTIALFHDGRRRIVAIDPTEDPARTGPALIDASEKLAARTSSAAGPGRDGPIALGNDRFFYLYAAPAGPGETVVVTSDAAMMLDAVIHRPTDGRGLVLVDPAGAIWIGCDQIQQCRPVPVGSPDGRQIMEVIDRGTRGESVATHPGLARLGLPSRVIVGVSPRVSSPLGSWAVVALAAATDFDLRQRGLLWELVLISAVVAVAILAVGLLILRQHANAAGLRARLQAAEQVARLQRQLVRAEKLVTVGVLSAGIAHEIGTPLAVVRGRAETMLERGCQQRQVEDLRAIVSEIDRISSTIRQVLDFSRDQPAKLGETDPHTAIERALDLLAWRLKRKRLLVDVDVAADVPMLAAAADQFEQVLVNLLLNACDASRSGTAIRVAVMRDEGRPDQLRIEVADRGTGIPQHQLNAVFDPYFTTKKRGEGTGLGLAIVGRIVRSHRGEISLRSTVGIGTVATVTWPVADGTPQRSVGHG